MARHPFFDLLTGYEAGTDREIKGKRFVSKAVSGRTAPERHSKSVQRILAFLRGFANLVSYTSMRTYGLFFGAFGLMTLLLEFATGYVSPEHQLSMPEMITGALFAILSIPFLSFDKPIAVAMQEFPITDAVMFEFFCIPRMQKKFSGRVLHPSIGVLIGLALAALGIIAPLWCIVLGIAAAFYIYLAIISPEFSFFFIFLVMPYLTMLEHSEIILAALVAITLISFVRKIVEGKRIYYFEQYDFLILTMLLIVFVNGIISGGIGSVGSSLVMLILGFGGYALTGSLVANRRLADCVIKANIISSLPISVIAIVQLILAAVSGELSEFDGSSATFDSPDMLGAFLLISAAFMLYFVVVRRHRGVKMTYSVYLFITLAAMACTLRVWLAVALVMGLFAFLVIKYTRVSWPGLSILALLPYAVVLLPGAVLANIAEVSALRALGISEYIESWIATRPLFTDNIFVGVGTGDFMDAPNSANFLLQIACEAGILVLVVFVMIFAVRLGHRSVYSPYTKNSQVSTLAQFSDMTVVALLVYGLVTSIWTAPTVYYLFWCVFGLGSAVLRIAKHEFDDRVGYFSDGAGADSSAIDISLKHH